jgi:hypothetical protein
MTKIFTLSTLAAITLGLTPAWAQAQKKQPASPPAATSITVDGKAVSIKYSAPSLKGRQMFGEGGRVSKDPNYPVWRAGANSATTLHTEADLDINGLPVPKGDYTLFALVNENVWQLIVSKETGQWGLAYKKENDLGRVKMTMSKPAAPIETYVMTLSNKGGNKAQLQLEWESVIASVTITVK